MESGLTLLKRQPPSLPEQGLQPAFRLAGMHDFSLHKVIHDPEGSPYNDPPRPGFPGKQAISCQQNGIQSGGPEKRGNILKLQARGHFGLHLEQPFHQVPARFLDSQEPFACQSMHIGLPFHPDLMQN